MNSFNENNGIKRLCSDLSENSKIDPKLFTTNFMSKEVSGIKTVRESWRESPISVMYMAML